MPPDLNRKLEPKEVVILRLKHAAVPFGRMNEKDLDNWVDALMLKAAAIAGWIIPEDDNALNILTDQFKKKLKESYATVNNEEFEYAFREYAGEVKDWGRNMNLGIIDQIIGKYLSSRAPISRIEEQTVLGDALVKFLDTKKEDMSDEAMGQWFDETVRAVRANEKTVHFMPVMLYEWLDGKGLIQKTNAEKRDYLSRAVPLRRKQIVEAYENSKSISDKLTLESFTAMEESGCFTGREIDLLKLIAKKIVLFDHISNL